MACDIRTDTRTPYSYLQSSEAIRSPSSIPTSTCMIHPTPYVVVRPSDGPRHVSLTCRLQVISTRFAE